MSGIDERSALFETVESVRAEEFPDLDADLLSQIVDLHLEMHEDQARARRETERLIRRWIAEDSGGRA